MATEEVEAAVPEQELERDKTTSDFVSGLKEREALKAEVAEKTKELNKVKGQNYDLLKRIDELEKQLSELKKDPEKPKRPSSGRGRKGSLSKKRPVKRKVPKKGKNSNKLSPDSIDTGDAFESPEKLYEAIAEKYPELPLSTVLLAEKKFAEADVNGDGTIDANELEKILDSSDLLFTKDQILEILKKVDVDQTDSIDFFECLAVLDQLRLNRKTGLPQSIQQNKSAICSIQ